MLLRRTIHTVLQIYDYTFRENFVVVFFLSVTSYIVILCFPQVCNIHFQALVYFKYFNRYLRYNGYYKYIDSQ